MITKSHELSGKVINVPVNKVSTYTVNFEKKVFLIVSFFPFFFTKKTPNNSIHFTKSLR